MRVTPPDLAAPGVAPSGGGTTVKVLAGQLADIPTGQLLRAMVTRLSAEQAVLTVNGQPLTVRTPPPGLPTGAAVLVRVPAGAVNSSLELVGRAAPETPPQTAPPGAAPPLAGAGAGQPARVALVEVLPQNAGGPTGAAGNPLQVVIDGRRETAVSSEPLAPGGRYVMQVERTPAGLTLRSPPDSPGLATDVAAAVLRAARPVDLGASLQPLLKELAALQKEQPHPVSQAAATAHEAVRGFLPSDGRPPNRTELQNLVDNGGLHFEAKLARQDPGTGTGRRGDAPPPPTGHEAATRAGAARSPDLKESLLKLIQAAQDIGTAAPLAAARGALAGVESQQAVNVAAQAQGTPYVLQIPFPDGGEWRTLNLAVEPERNGRSGPGGGDGFRLLMHVPLADLGETWIDAGLSGNRLRAVVYLESSAARDRVRGELPGLRDQLLTEGFNEVLLDVRPADALPTRQRRQAAAMQAGWPAGLSILDVRA